MFYLRMAFVAGLCLAGSALRAGTFTVNSTADIVDATPGNGVCETALGNGVCTLRAALQEAGALAGAQTVVVPAGTYLLSATPACTYKLAIDPTHPITENMSALCVRGNVTITGAGSDVTVIDAGGASGATCCGGYPAARGMVTSSDTVATISGLTIQHGLGLGGYTCVGGGGICNQGKLTLINTVLSANSGVGGGGVINSGILSAESTAFTANTAGAWGGAGVYNTASGTAAIGHSTLNLNASTTNGGAIENSGTLSVTSSTINGNNAPGGNGGGIDSTGTLTLTNVTISGNLARTNTGVNNSGTTVTNNVTIANNRATVNIGGIAGDGTFTIRNTIIGNNLSDGSIWKDCGLGVKIISQGHNLVSNTTGCTITGSTATNIYNRDPGLTALASNGGGTQTHALLATSPAVDAGDTTAPGTGGTACAAADQRGIFRPQNGRCDIGAFERGVNLSVSGILPAHAGNVGVTQATISGGGMAGGAAAKLKRSGQPDIAGNPVTVQDGDAALAASFDLTGAAPGAWDVVITNPDNTAVTLSAGFTVDSGGTPKVWAEVTGPTVARPGGVSQYSIAYGNTGNADAVGVPLGISTPTQALLTLTFPVFPPPVQPGRTALDWTNAPMTVTPAPAHGFVNVPLFIPVIPAGYTGALPFTLDIPSSLHEGDSFQFSAGTGDPYFNPTLSASVVNTIASGARNYAQANLGAVVPESQLPALAQYVTNQLQTVVANGRAAFNSSVGSAPQVYSLSFLSLDAAAYAAAGSPGLASGKTPAGTLAYARASRRPARSRYCLPGSTDPGCKVEPGTWAPFPNTTVTWVDCMALPGYYPSSDGTVCVPYPNCSEVWSDRVCPVLKIRQAIDPNAKFGPAGPGAQQFQTGASAFQYTVEFENMATASLPAQQVVVTDQLDTATLDISTFALGKIGFGAYSVTPPPGSTQFTTAIDLRPDTNLLAKIDASMNPTSGLVTWRFTSLDPSTEQFTSDVLAGFLPPNVTPPQGQATLLYSVSPKASLASGAVICNQATVVFDSNAPIGTGNYCNTLDKTPPASQVQALPAAQNTTAFPVQWTGSDAGAGVQDYSIYVSDNGGAYSAWLTNTKLTQASYTGAGGHTYRFYSAARDLVGNVEGAKYAPDASTYVNPCATDVSSQFSIVRGGYRLNNATKRFQQTVTITRTGAGSLAGPFALAVEGLSSNASLYNPAGATTCIAPGSTYVTVNPGASWNTGQAVTVAIEFVNPTNAGITYTPALLAGPRR